MMKKSSRVLWFKILLAVFALTLVLSPISFNRVPEIEQRVVVSVMGIDAAPEGFKVSAQVIIPKRGEGDPKQEVVDAEGGSVSEAVDKLNRAMGRKADLGHCGVIVIGKEMAEKGVKSELEYMFAGGIVTPGTNLVCTLTPAGEFIKGAVSMAANSVTGLDSFITFASSGSHTATLTLNRFLSSTEGESKTSYMPVLELEQGTGGEQGGAGSGQSGSEQSGGSQQGEEKEQQQGGAQGQDGGQSGAQGQSNQQGQSGSSQNGQQEQQSQQGQDRQQSDSQGDSQGQSGSQGGGQGGSQGQQSQQKGDQAQSGGQGQATIKSAETVAVFYDGRLTGILDAQLTRGVVWADRQSDRGQVQLDAFSHGDKEYGAFFAKLQHKKRSFRAAFEQGNPVFTVKLRVRVELEDKHKLKMLAEEVGEGEATRLLEKAFAHKIEREVASAYSAGIAMGADLYEVRSRFYKTRFDEYKTYGKEQFLTDVALRFDVRVQVV